VDRRSALVIIAALVVSFSTPAHAAAPQQRYIVVYRAGTDAVTKTAQLERSQHFTTDYRYAHAIRGFAARLSAAQVASLRADPSVAFVGETITWRTTRHAAEAEKRNREVARFHRLEVEH